MRGKFLLALCFIALTSESARSEGVLSPEMLLANVKSLAASPDLTAEQVSSFFDLELVSTPTQYGENFRPVSRPSWARAFSYGYGQLYGQRKFVNLTIALSPDLVCLSLDNVIRVFGSNYVRTAGGYSDPDPRSWKNDIWGVIYQSSFNYHVSFTFEYRNCATLLGIESPI